MDITPDKFYFVRHGQTEANLTNRAAGSGWDIELNQTGLDQARALAESERLKLCHDVKTICVSPLLRAMQTAEAINQVIQAPLVVIDELKEWHLGDWERGSWTELPSLYEPGTHPPNGESQLQFGMRVKNGLDKALTYNGTVMIVAHGGVWHAISKILSMPKSSIDNCDLRLVHRDPETKHWSFD